MCAECRWYHLAIMSWLWPLAAIAFVSYLWWVIPSSESAILKIALFLGQMLGALCVTSPWSLIAVE